MTTQRQACEIWANQTGIPIGSINHAVAALLNEGLIRRQGRGGGKAGVHWTDIELTYFALAMVSVAAGLAVTGTGRIAKLLYSATPLESAGVPKMPSMLPGRTLGDGLSTITAAAHNNYEGLRISIGFRPRSYCIVHVQRTVRSAATENEFYYAASADPEGDHSGLLERREFPCAMECVITLSDVHFRLLERMRTGQTPTKASNNTSVLLQIDLSDTKNGASVPPETPPSDDPEKPVSKPRTRSQNRALNKPDPTRARSRAQEASRDPGRANRPPTRRHHHVEHCATGD